MENKADGINVYRAVDFTLLNDEPFEDFLAGVVFAICQKQGKYLVLDSGFRKIVVNNESHLRHIPNFVDTKKPSRCSTFQLAAETNS